MKLFRDIKKWFDNQEHLFYLFLVILIVPNVVLCFTEPISWLAKQLNKSFSMVNAYACNRIQPNLETLQQIAVILQVDLKDLITDKEER